MRKNAPRWVTPSQEAWELAGGFLLLTLGSIGAVAAYAASPSGLVPVALFGVLLAAVGIVLLAHVLLNSPDELEGEPGGRFPDKIPIPPRIWLYVIAASVGVLFLLILPFFPDYPWNFIDQLKGAADVPVYRVGSFWAYNFWGIFGFFHADNPASCDPANGCTGATFIGIDYRYWGLILFAICLAGIIYSLRKSEGKAPLALGTALCLLAFYAFTTRMHERYLFPFFLPFLAACVLYRNPVLWASFAALAVLHTVNLYHVYVYYQSGDHHTELMITWLYDRLSESDFLGLGEATRVFSVPIALSVPVLLAATYLLLNPIERARAK